jgi:hypothetical protein
MHWNNFAVPYYRNTAVQQNGNTSVPRIALHSALSPQSSVLKFTGGPMKEILEQMEEHIAAIRNLQRNFDFHSKRLEKLMLHLQNYHLEKNRSDDSEFQQLDTKNE